MHGQRARTVRGGPTCYRALTLSASCGTGLQCPAARVAVLPCRAHCESDRAVMHRTIGAVGVRRLSGGPDVRPAEASGRGRP